MSEYHEAPEDLPEEVRDNHRAVKSLMEELEAVDWYQQRIAASQDESLAAILAHNRDEEIEHASMLLEWLRRRSPKWDENLRKYLFASAPILEVEAAADREEKAQTDGGGDLGIRDLKKKGR